MYNHRSYFNFEAGRGSIYKSPPKSKPKTNPGKQFADSMKKAGIGGLGGKPTTSAAKKIQDRFRRETQKDSGSSYDEIALPSEEKVDNVIKGLGAPDKPDDDKQDQSPIERIKSTFDSVSEMMGLGKPEKPRQPVYTPQNVYNTAAFRARASSRNPIDFAAQQRRFDAALDFENRTPISYFPQAGTYDEIKKQKGADERNQKQMADSINATIEQLYAANDPARQFYQSGVPMEQRLFAPELGYDEIALPSEATVDKKIKGLGARPEVTVTELDATTPTTLTPAQQTALSDLGSDVVRTNLQNITDTQGNYSQTALTNALDKGIKNTNKKALLKGAVETEIGDRGLVTEATGYRLNRAYEMFNDDIVDAALESLSQAEQTRVRNGAASNALGLAIMDRRYDGGSEYRGRGLVQLTHRRNYQAVQNILASNGININLVGNPDLANDTRYALPIAMAYLEHAGLDDDAADNSSAKDLNNRINAGANSTIANERWDNVVQALRDAGKDSEADTMENRNEYAAQQTAGTAVDGIIGPNSRAAMTAWLTERNITIPPNATDMDLVVLVNENS